MKTTLRTLTAGAAFSALSMLTDAAPGDLDLTLNGTGKVTTSFDYPDPSSPTDIGTGIAVQSDGRIVVCGIPARADFGLVRYLANGALDTSFGAGGKVTTSFYAPTNYDEGAFAVALQSDGKIVAGGYGLPYFPEAVMALVRYSPIDGSLDPTFGVGGKAPAGNSGAQVNALKLKNSIAYGIAIQSDGKIVAVGQSEHGGINESNLAMVRFNPDGTLDTGFGPGTTPGAVTTDINASRGFGGASVARGVVLQSDGKIVVAGYTYGGPAGQTDDFVLVRYLTNGELDPSFGTGGIVTTDLQGSSHDRAFGLALQKDGRIVLVGYSVPPGGSNTDVALVRYLTNGALDPSFGSAGTGIVINSFSASTDRASSVVIQGDGRIVVAGNAFVGGFNNADSLVARYLPNGTLDPAFGIGGKVLTNIGGADYLNGVALQADGRIVAAGAGETTSNQTDFSLLRLESGSAGDTDGDGLCDTWELTYWPTVVGHSAGDDFDHDGVPELLEEAFGLNPTVPDSALMPRPVAEAGYLTMTITKHPCVIYEVQSAGTLLDGQPASFSATTTTVLLDNATTLKVRDNVLIGTPPARFLRVQVTSAP